jgi:hypothetical protein
MGQASGVRGLRRRWIIGCLLPACRVGRPKGEPRKTPKQRQSKEEEEHEHEQEEMKGQTILAA